MLSPGLAVLARATRPRHRQVLLPRRPLSSIGSGTKILDTNRTDKLDYWYKEGLKFKCTGCGKCCTGASGWVWISDDDIDAISQRLKISRHEFIENYAEYVPEKRRYSLRERVVQATSSDPNRDTEFECIFLDGKMCSIYDIRPQQCRTFPWWPDVTRSRNSWNAEKQRCLDHPDAKITPAHVISEAVEQERNSKARKGRAKLK